MSEVDHRYALSPIGIIRTPFVHASGIPIQTAFDRENTQGTIEVNLEYRDGLQDLEGFDRIWLFYLFHQTAGPKLRVTPFLDTQSHGVFSTRSPCRPNPIGLSCVRLIAIEGGLIHFQGVDVIDGTPLLDIKPYVPQFDVFTVSRCGWFDHAHGGVTVADQRFSRGS